LIESGMVEALCDSVWVVTAPRRVQLERLVQHRGLSKEEATLRIDAQPPQEVKATHADVVIDNSGTLENTEQQVEDAWKAIAR